MDRKFRINEITDIDFYRGLLVSFWQNNLVSDYSDARINWLYRDNPNGATHTFLAFSEEKEEIIGCGSFYPCTFSSKGVPLRVAIPVDFGVDRNFRVFGPAIGIQRSIVSSIDKMGFEFAFVYPNEQSSNVFQRVGFKYVGQGKGWILILKSQPWISKYFHSAIIVKGLSTIADIILSAIHSVIYIIDYNKCHCEVSNYCSNSFDELWEREKIYYPLIAEKSSRYLNWYYSENKAIKYSYYCLYDKKNGKLQGFIIYTIKKDHVEIADIFPPKGKSLRLLLSNFIRHVRHQQIPSIRLCFFGSDDFINTIERYGFITKKDGEKRDYLFYLKKETADTYMLLIKDIKNIFFFYS